MEERDSREAGSEARSVLASDPDSHTRPARSGSPAGHSILQGVISAIHRNGAGGGRDTAARAFWRGLSTDWVNRRFITCDLEGRSSDEAVTDGVELVAGRAGPASGDLQSGSSHLTVVGSVMTALSSNSMGGFVRIRG